MKIFINVNKICLKLILKNQILLYYHISFLNTIPEWVIKAKLLKKKSMTDDLE